jgi:hypothetical protein
MHFKWYVTKRTKKLQLQYLGFIDYVLAYYASMKHENINNFVWNIPFQSETTKYFDGYNFENMYER